MWDTGCCRGGLSAEQMLLTAQAALWMSRAPQVETPVGNAPWGAWLVAGCSMPQLGHVATMAQDVKSVS